MQERENVIPQLKFIVKDKQNISIPVITNYSIVFYILGQLLSNVSILSMCVNLRIH